MKIRKLKQGFFEGSWVISYTIMGDRKWHYMEINAKDEMLAFIKASKLAQDHELKEAKRVVSEWNYIKKRMPSAELTKDIAKAKKLLTDVNKNQVRTT